MTLVEDGSRELNQGLSNDVLLQADGIMIADFDFDQSQVKEAEAECG